MEIDQLVFQGLPHEAGDQKGKFQIVNLFLSDNVHLVPLERFRIQKEQKCRGHVPAVQIIPATGDCLRGIGMDEDQIGRAHV